MIVCRVGKAKAYPPIQIIKVGNFILPTLHTADEFDKWVYKNGRKINGLINRREEEKKMFLKPDE